MQNRSIKEMAVLSTVIISAIMISPFIFIRFANGEPIIAVLDMMIVLMLISIALYVYTTRKTQIAGAVLSIGALISIVAIVYLQGSSYGIWIYPAIMATFYLLPLKGAFAFSLVSLISLSILFYPQLNIIKFLSFIATFVLTVLFSVVFMKTIQRHGNKISANQRINNYRNAILELIVQSTPLSEILHAIAKNAELEFANVRCSITLVDENEEKILIGAAPSLTASYRKTIDAQEIAHQTCFSAVCAITKQRLIIDDISHGQQWEKMKDYSQQENIASCWAEPIINSKKQVVGVFEIFHSEPATPLEKHFAIIELFAQMASIAIEKEYATQLIWQQANFDNLTKLPNRHMMHEHLTFSLKASARHKQKMAVIFLDMDHFKDINDTLGHEYGDLLLIEIASRIKNTIRKNDVVARLGGDEFVILINELKDINGVNRIVENTLKSLAEPYYLKDEVVHSSASMGITIYPDDGKDIDTILRNADQAMYGAKAIGRNNYHYFTDTMRDSAVKRMSLINDLRCAVSNNELFLVYQPIIDLSTSTMSKAEALIRWKHPVHGIVSPLDFIPLAEETGLIIEISNWIFKQVVKDIKHWQETFDCEIQISINTSPRQYMSNDGNIPQWLNWINEQEIDPKLLAFEITENLLMETQSSLEQMLIDIKNAGIELSIDDFGTGYSSFSYLREFHTNYVKIDKSFVQKMSLESSDLALCEAIIVMAQKLDIKVIAEGIETQEQQKLLQEIGCDYGQGYLISRPVVAQEFEKLFQ